MSSREAKKPAAAAAAPPRSSPLTSNALGGRSNASVNKLGVVTVKTQTSTFRHVVVTLIAVIAFVIRWYFKFQASVEDPPSDYGSGHMFNLIAKRYDMINRALALGMDVGWRQRMVETVVASVESSSSLPRVLDVATGTADVALLLAKQFEVTQQSFEILGVDPSENMLQVGREKVQQQQASINLQQMDARDLSQLQTQTFDAATMAFGIRNVPVPRSDALCEIHRVLKPSSVFCILEFSEPSQQEGVLPFMATLFIRHVVPVLGGLLSGAPREYLHLQKSIREFPTPQEFAAQLEALECGGERNGYFAMQELVQMNFGSVQLYVTKSHERNVAVQQDDETQDEHQETPPEQEQEPETLQESEQLDGDERPPATGEGGTTDDEEL